MKEQIEKELRKDFEQEHPEFKYPIIDVYRSERQYSIYLENKLILARQEIERKDKVIEAVREHYYKHPNCFCTYCNAYREYIDK